MYDFDAGLFAALVMRIAIAAVLGGALGLEREIHGHWAGLRTHMGVAMGAALFASAGMLFCGEAPAENTRVIQGITAGVGFLGGGAILKLGNQLEIKGLTTAASIWLASSVGTAAGLSLYELACAGTLVSLIVLAILRPVEKRMERTAESRRRPRDAAERE